MMAANPRLLVSLTGVFNKAAKPDNEKDVKGDIAINDDTDKSGE